MGSEGVRAPAGVEEEVSDTSRQTGTADTNALQHTGSAPAGDAQSKRRKLKRLLLRYYPPGIILEHKEDGEIYQRSIDLLDLSPSTETEVLVSHVVEQEAPLLGESKRSAVRHMVHKLQSKLAQQSAHRDYELFKVVRAHVLPLTNVAFNKGGDRFITGSYDRTCKLFDTFTGEELHTLEGHKNVVYSVAFNVPYADKIATGSFDRTCKLWDAFTGQLYYTLHGHVNEVVCVCFDPQSILIATGSMDATAKLWDVAYGPERATLKGHSAEVVSLRFSTTGECVITGSFDHDARVWDARSGECMFSLVGHQGEVSSALFNFAGTLCATASIDRTVRVWDATDGKCLQVRQGHTDEVLDATFDATGKLLATASADETTRVYNVLSGQCLHVLSGHEGEISRVVFNAQSTKLATASSDRTVRVWDVESGQCLQVLEGHSDEIFSVRAYHMTQACSAMFMDAACSSFYLFNCVAYSIHRCKLISAFYLHAGIVQL